MPAEDLEQHWVCPEAARRVAALLPVQGARLVELGAGQGALTRALLEAGAAHIIAWEIDPSLPAPQDWRVQWRLGDIFHLRPEDLGERPVVAFAPYRALSHIQAILGDREAALMVPQKRLAGWLRLGFRVIATLDGGAFDPPAQGSHAVIARGFLRSFSPPPALQNR